MPPLTDMPSDPLGCGPEFPVRIDDTGSLALVRDEEKVRQSIKIILSTVKGERVMRPDFGCDIHAFVFTTLDTTSLTLIKSAVREALVRWEPRIELGEINLLPESERGRLHIRISYTIRSTNSPANLVYPFYLQTGD